MWVVSGYFQLCVNQRFSLSDSRCMSDAITSRKLEQTGNILGQPRLFECMGICVLSPAHERNEGLPCLSADCKILIPLVVFKVSQSGEIWGDLRKKIRGVCQPYH